MFGEGLIGGLVGGALNYQGAREANKMNQKISREQMGFQKASTQEQMAFQERMSNTAYQRSIEDMKKAGINPMVAFMQGGASTPSGASSSGSNYEYKNKFSGALSTALQAKSVAAQTAQTEALTEIAKAALVEKKLEAEMYTTKAGKILKGIQMLSGPANDLTGILKLLVK